MFGVFDRITETPDAWIVWTYERGPINYYKHPETWLPVKPNNPSKLTLHLFKNGKWAETPVCRFVPYGG